MAIYDGRGSAYSMTSGGDGGELFADGSANEVPKPSGVCEQHNGRASSPTAIFNPYYTGRPRTSINGHKHEPLDRQEIIRKIKSRESRPTSPELERPSSTLVRKRRSPTPLNPPESKVDLRAQSPEKQDDMATLGNQIERPRSALHRGDFREKELVSAESGRLRDSSQDEPQSLLPTSPVAPWHPNFPATAYRHAREEWQQPTSPPSRIDPLFPQRPQRVRATSNTLLTASFLYKAPTSPLVQSSRPDTPEPGPRRTSRSPDKSCRHTFSPQALQRFHSSLDYATSVREYGHQQPPPLRSERTFPYQAHQPRRSLNSFQSLPQTPMWRSRRPSFTDPPLHHAPMVGSYEESILRGRMSTTPSKPLNFVAQIGVLGRGNCKSNLRCPPHVTVPFPAVFYSNPSASATMDQPSPYVGLIDLENYLPNQDLSLEKRRHRLHTTLSDEGSRANSRTREDGSTSDAQARRRRKQKQKRRSGSPKAPPGGSYRIPQQGQLQIIIKNPNKTAVKLFLVPYDLSDMEPGQKTFIRQRSYSAGPIIDMPLSSRKNFGTDRPEAAINTTDDPNERPMLRYLIHLHICCPSKGRYFLYKSIRVVFANRVPDGKEKLRNEIQLPDPKYSVYKPGRDSTAGLTGNTTPKDQTRRRSGAESIPPSQESPWPLNRRHMAQSLPSENYGIDFGLPMQPLPFHVSPLQRLESRPSSRKMSDGMMDIDCDLTSHETQSLRSALSSPTSKKGEPIAGLDVRSLQEPFNFEKKEGSRPDLSGPVAGGARNESLLSRRLRDLAFQGLGEGSECGDSEEL